MLPQGFQDNLHLFGEALSRDLRQFNSPSTKLLQYANDILFCTLSEETSEEKTKALQKFLAERGYKVSEAKSQLCLAQSSTLAFICQREHVLRRGPGWCYSQLPSAPDFKAMKRLLGHRRVLQAMDSWLWGNRMPSFPTDQGGPKKQFLYFRLGTRG